MIYILYTIYVLACVFLILVILLQSGKGGDVTAAFGGAGSQTAFGPRGAQKPLEKATIVAAVLFLLLVLSTAGVPPFLGFWPKLLLLQAGIANLPPAGGALTDFVDLAVAIALLVNALLTLIAGTRLWSHVFWRVGTEGAQSEQAATQLIAMSRRERLFGIGAAAGLTAVVFALGLWPQPLLAIGRTASASLLDPHAYISAVGLRGAP